MHDLETQMASALRDMIPLAGAMGVRVAHLDEGRVVLAAPLEPNLTLNGSAFGGSIAAVAVMAGWLLLQHRLAGRGIMARVVIQRNTLEYRAPVAHGFEAHSEVKDGPAWDRLLAMLRRHRRGRISVEVTVTSNGCEAAHFRGEYVALLLPQASGP